MFLLSKVGKIFVRVVLVRRNQLEELVYLESHCTFRSDRSTVDMNFFSPSAAEKNVQTRIYHCIFHSLILQKLLIS